jgi:ACS family hexuronate transporter-like MFS transporter
MATTIMYMDRTVFALLAPTLMDPVKGIGMTQIQYGALVGLFACAYALGVLLAGNVVDRIGSKKGYALAVVVWATAAMCHYFATVRAVTGTLSVAARMLSHAVLSVPGLHNAGWARSLGILPGAVIAFGVLRFLLGLGQSGNFPAAVKATAEWFPKKERSFTTGIFNSGTNIGAAIVPFLVGFVVMRFGWRYAFFSTIVFSLIWLALWLTQYTRPQDSKHVKPAELAYINSDPAESATKIPWTKLFLHRQTWAFLCGKAITDPIWWFYVSWLPLYLYSKFGLSILKMTVPFFLIYGMCTVGSVLGGWLPTKFINMGWSLNRSRKTALLLYAIGIVPIMFIGYAPNIWVAIAMFSAATGLHQAWSCNLFTLPSDMFPRRAVASVTGIGQFGGAMAVMFFGTLVGCILTRTHNNYTTIFIMAGVAYLVAILIIHLLVPNMAPADIE